MGSLGLGSLRSLGLSRSHLALALGLPGTHLTTLGTLALHLTSLGTLTLHLALGLARTHLALGHALTLRHPLALGHSLALLGHALALLLALGALTLTHLHHWSLSLLTLRALSSLGLTLGHTLALVHALALVHLALVHALAHLVHALALVLPHWPHSLALGHLGLGLVRGLLLTLALGSRHAHVAMGTCGGSMLLAQHDFDCSQTLLFEPDLVQLLLQLLATVISRVGVTDDLLQLLHGLLPLVLRSARRLEVLDPERLLLLVRHFVEVGGLSSQQKRLGLEQLLVHPRVVCGVGWVGRRVGGDGRVALVRSACSLRIGGHSALALALLTLLTLVLLSLTLVIHSHSHSLLLRNLSLLLLSLLNLPLLTLSLLTLSLLTLLSTLTSHLLPHSTLDLSDQLTQPLRVHKMLLASALSR